MGCKQSAPKEATEVAPAEPQSEPQSDAAASTSGQENEAVGKETSQQSARMNRTLSKLRRSDTWAANLGGAKKKRLLGLVREEGDATFSDVWLQASFDVQLQKLLWDHPYLDEAGSSEPHPLQTWTSRCKESNDSRRFGQAHLHLRRLRAGLQAELRPILEAFRRFDLDGSGHIDPAEFRHMCAYLGWGEEDVNLMDLDRDGRVTLPDFQAFVGHMGGVHQLFEKRRLRITRSRKDVCDYAGIAVGALVRSHFYVRGQKSKGWKEGRVVAVGVERGGGGEGQGPSVLGVLLEFGFGPADRWKTRQVVPTHWVLGGVEDASVAAALREVGILDEQQCFWALLLPDSEMHAMRHLTDHQKAAVKLCRERATSSHEKALATCRERFQQLGFGEPELQAVLGWVQDLAPVIVHLGLDEAGRLLETDEFYRSQSELKPSEEDDTASKDVEASLFGGHYKDAKPFERVKYAALNVMNDYRGVTEIAKPGDSYLVLKDVRLRCTFTAGESAQRTVDDIAVLDKYAHVLAEYSDAEIKGLVGVATGAIASEREGGLPTSGAARLTLLRGSSEDPTNEWVTFGFPGLEQRSGRYYYEVQLFAGCSTPQVGLLDPAFQRMPYVASTQGVGDDVHGWAIDGQNAARWHGGSMRPWNISWASEKPDAGGNSQAAPSPWGGIGSGRQKVRVLSNVVVVGVAVDLDNRAIRFATDGEWDEDIAFGPEDLPEGTALFPAISLKGRAAFMFSPVEFKHAPPDLPGGKFLQWPSTPAALVRLDCPDLGNSQILSLHKEVQIHGEVHLKRNVQRLVANDKYRLKPKTNRSFALIVTNAGLCSGMYNRIGAHEEKPLYKSPLGAVIYWDPKGNQWKMNSTESFTSCFGYAPVDASTPDEPPRQGWHLPDEAQGVLDKGAFQSALQEAGLSKGDVDGLLAALADGELVYRVKGGTKLAKEWSKLKDPPLTAEAAWEAAIKSLQLKILQEASTGIGYPQLAQVGQVVESKHPYDARRFNWTREVQFKDTMSMSVYLASKCCTVDQRTTMTISAGGLNKNAMGPGTRMEVMGPNGSKVMGTLVERVDGGQLWKVRLDRPKGEVSDAAPAVPKAAPAKWSAKEGDKVEVQKDDGEWHEAKVTGIFGGHDWYSGESTQQYLVEFLNDSEKLPCKKTSAQVRQSWDHVLADVGDVPMDPTVTAGQGEILTVCMETPKAAMVKYEGDVQVGHEIASFVLDTSNTLAPIAIGALAKSGPAQEQGVAKGWSLDLAGSIMGQSRAPLANLLQGIGGFELPPKTSKVQGGRLNNKVMNKLVQVVFANLDETIVRLNEGLRETCGVTLLFKSAVQAKMLPEIHVRYEGGKRVGSEIKQFTTEARAAAPKPQPSSPFGWSPFGQPPSPPKQVRPDGFQNAGPAQAAGVRGDWVLDIGKTIEINPGKEQALAEEVLLENPNVLLGLADVTLVFKQPNPKKVAMFVGSGPPDSERWKCSELPGDSAEFQFSADGDGVNSPEKRWGFWALVLPSDAPRLSTQTVDGLVDKWVEVTSRAIGIDKAPCCERDEWDEQRLRTLCARHGWEFEWMTEDGERRRRANERQGFFLASGQLAGVRDAAEARAAVMVQQQSAG